MKEIISIELRMQKSDFCTYQTDLLAVGVFSDAKGLDGICRELDEKLSGSIRRLIDLGDFKGKKGTGVILYGNAGTGAKRIILIGLGEKKKASLDTIRKAASQAANSAVAAKAATLAVALHAPFAGRFDLSVISQTIAEGIYFGGYRYDEFITDKEKVRPAALTVHLIDPDAVKLKKLSSGLITGVIIGKAQSYARTLSNRPANLINPEELARLAKQAAGTSKNLTCTVFDEKQLAAKGMGGILAVGGGSQNKPRLIILDYMPPAASAKISPKIALVGKAITFDSGGLDLKPAANMEQMKLDKSGGITVLSTMIAAAEMKLPLHICGIIPAAENMPSGTSYRPGDIITTFSGKTIEVQNTDAEGRIILCDAISYAAQENFSVIIDIATLTGACMVALGSHMAGLMGNDGRLIKQMQTAAEQSGENVWHLPSGEEYAAEMKGKAADLKNSGGRWGGACTAAAFLKQFVGDKKWAHLDIAGMDMIEKTTEFATEGSSGFGVRLLIAYLMNQVKSKKSK